MSNLLTRAISGFVYVLLFIVAIVLGYKSYLSLITLFSIICLWEFSKIIQSKNILPYLFLGLVSYLSFFTLKNSIVNFVIVFSVIGLLLLIFYLIFKKEIKTENSIQKIFLQFIYLILPFYFLMNLPFVNSSYEYYIIISILFLIWINDTFAFIIGKSFGKNKLFESVSPKKTIEGFFGGFISSLISSVLIWYYLDTHFSLINWIILAVILSVFGTLGDLVESKFKRQAKVKDSGNIMPGHGGMLDRLDSLFFAAPFVYLYLHYVI